MLWLNTPSVIEEYEAAISVGDVHPLLFRRDLEIESWLMPRPTELGGVWALGCCACYAMLRRNGCSPGNFDRRTSTWPGK